MSKKMAPALAGLLVGCQPLVYASAIVPFVSLTAQANEALQFNIAAQPLVAALKAFAEQSQMQLLYKHEPVERVSGNAVVGSFTKREALERLLKDTGLEAVLTSDDIATIRPKSAQSTLLVADTHDVRLAQNTGATSKVAADSDEFSLEEIVVTARRREESLSSVPVAIAAFTQDTLTERAITSVFDLNKAVPGLTVQANNGSTVLPAFSIRGRGQNYGAASGSVETYFAEVPLSPPFQEVTLPVQFFDLASLQVLKGPQGTLFGRNTTGGAVLVVPAAPTDKFEGYARVQVGDYSNRQIEAAINLPILDERIDLRLAAFHWKRDGYLQTIGGGIEQLTGRTLPSQDFQNQNTTEFRATLRLRPFDGFENSTLFTYHYDKVRTALSPGLNGAFGIGTPVAVEPDSGLTVVQSPYYGTRYLDTLVDLNRPATKVWAVINTTSYELTDKLTLKNIFGYIDARGYTTTAQDADGSIEANNDILLPPRANVNKQFTDEVQLQGKSLDDRLTWTVGGLLDQTREPGGSTMNYNDYSSSFGSYTTVFEQNSFSSKSLFAAGTFALTDELNMSAGFRHSWDDITLLYQVFGDFVPAGLLTDSNPDLGNKASKNFQGNSYNLGLDWHPTKDTMVYGGYRRGYKRGGFNPNSGGSFGQETVDDFNLGVKHDFVTEGGMRGRFAVEGFYDFYHDQQVSYVAVDPVTFTAVGVTTNIKRTDFRGFELDGMIEPTDWLNLSGAFSFVDAKNKDWMDESRPDLGTQDLTVNPVAYVSKYKTSVTAKFHTELSAQGDEVSIAPSINYQAKFYTSPNAVSLPLATQAGLGTLFNGGTPYNFNQLAVGGATVPAYTTYDLRMEWNKIRGSSVSLAANVTNLTNKKYLLYANGAIYFGSGAVTPAAPRMFMVEARVAF